MIKSADACLGCKYADECGKYKNCVYCEMHRGDGACNCNLIEYGEECAFYKPIVTEPIITGTNTRFTKLLAEEYGIFKQKNEKYGNSFEKSVDEFGLISAVVRMSDKFNRLKTLIQNNDKGTNDESLRDTLMDLANYCNLTVIYLEEHDA
jgi:hypothetical protein